MNFDSSVFFSETNLSVGVPSIMLDCGQPTPNSVQGLEPHKETKENHNSVYGRTFDGVVTKKSILIAMVGT